MKIKTGDKNSILTYLQIKLKEEFNPNVIVNGEYYKSFNNNYGLAHHIANYLNTMYPPLYYTYENGEIAEINHLYDSVSENGKTYGEQVREPNLPISILNYFLCDNKGNRIDTSIYKNKVITVDNESVINELYGLCTNTIYSNIYSNNIVKITNYSSLNDYPIIQDDTWESYNESLTDKSLEKINLLDLDSEYCINIRRLYKISEDNKDLTIDTNEYKAMKKSLNKYKVFRLPKWNTDKEICELDDLVLSYLLGRTITPESSREEIYYIQTLLIGEGLDNKYKGIWKTDLYDLTALIMNYQASHFNPYDLHPLFVTGYFDIFTESSLLKERGVQERGICGI